MDRPFVRARARACCCCCCFRLDRRAIVLCKYNACLSAGGWSWSWWGRSSAACSRSISCCCRRALAFFIKSLPNPPLLCFLLPHLRVKGAVCSSDNSVGSLTLHQIIEQVCKINRPAMFEELEYGVQVGGFYAKLKHTTSVYGCIEVLLRCAFIYEVNIYNIHTCICLYQHYTKGGGTRTKQGQSLSSVKTYPLR